jgi:hypothetical protein
MFENLDRSDWERLERYQTDYEWDAAWEAALQAGAGPAAETAMRAAQRAGAGKRAAAVAAAAVAATQVAAQLDAGQLARLRAPLDPGAAVSAVAHAGKRRSTRWALIRRCPLVAAAAALAGGRG